MHIYRYVPAFNNSILILYDYFNQGMKLKYLCRDLTNVYKANAKPLLAIYKISLTHKV